MSSIRIPEPCHENWADFTPTQKGAFCGSCQIDVIDFSGKSAEEVKAILKENAGKHLCGRFRKSQLDELNNEFYAWENQTVRSFQSKFLYACLIVFGMSLFTSCNISEQNFLNEIGMGQSDKESELHILKPHADNDKDTTKSDRNHYRKGKIKYEESEPVDINELLLGKPTMDESENIAPPDSLENTTLLEQKNCCVKGNVKDENSTVKEDTLFNDQMIDGEIEWTSEFEEFVDDTTGNLDTTQQLHEDRHIKGEIILEKIVETGTVVESEPDDSLTIEGITGTSALPFPVFEMVFDAQLFPNPVQDKTTVVINVKNAEIFNVYLYAIDGKKVKDIYRGMLETGRSEFTIDLSGYGSGSYLIIINAGKQGESLKLEKLH